MMAFNMDNTGTDDKAYVALYDKYKQNRGKDPQGAMKYLDAAMKLRERGNVSQDAIIGAAYL
jgi:hypothetical protein